MGVVTKKGDDRDDDDKFNLLFNERMVQLIRFLNNLLSEKNLMFFSFLNTCLSKVETPSVG